MFELFQKSKLDGEDWKTQRTYCIGILFDENKTIKKRFFDANYKYEHSEARMLPKIEKYITGTYNKEEKLVLRIYISDAPCDDCAPKLKSFLSEYNISIEIKAVSPYYKNEQDLCQMLTRRQISLQAFEMNDWKEFHEFLKHFHKLKGELRISWEPTDAMTDRDSKTAEKFDDL